MGGFIHSSALDARKAIAWNFPEDSVNFHQTLASAPTTTLLNKPSEQLTNPNGYLSYDHGSAIGEQHRAFTNPEADTGYIKGSEKGSTWMFAASSTVLIFLATAGAFFAIRARTRALEMDKRRTTSYLVTKKIAICPWVSWSAAVHVVRCAAGEVSARTSCMMHLVNEAEKKAMTTKMSSLHCRQAVT